MAEMQENRMTVAQLLDVIRNTYAEYEITLNSIPTARLNEPILGKWTPKDLMAHVMWSEREMVQVLKTRIFAGSDLWLKPEDDRNQAIYEENRSRTHDDVVNEHRAVHRELVALIEQMTDDDLNNPAAIADLPDDLMPWRLLMGNTYKHYQEHTHDLRKALDGHA